MSFLYPESPPIGSILEVMRAGERQQLGTASVRGGEGTSLVLGGHRFAIDVDALTLRWWDDNDEAWEVVASVERSDPETGEVAVRLVDGWRPAVLRRAVRVAIDRAPVDLVTLGGDGREVRRVRVICLDLSPTGCGVAGSGPPPADGAVFQLVAETPAVSVRIDARVMRLAPGAFGGWQAGLEFLPHNPEERAMLVAWRDSAASR